MAVPLGTSQRVRSIGTEPRECLGLNADVRYPKLNTPQRGGIQLLVLVPMVVLW